MQPGWSHDQRLDILVLGPMGDTKNPTASTAPIAEAVRALLKEKEFDTLLTAAGVAPEDRVVHVPEGLRGQEIVQRVLRQLDTADLVIFNFTPKTGRTEASANVFYELALVHALGIPAIMLKAGPERVPFYVNTTEVHRVKDFELETLTKALRKPLFDFLDPNSDQGSLVNDRVSQFYGLPIADISAAVGLATGYYQNFLSRLIAEGGFIAAHPKLIRHVIYVRPASVDSTYPADVAALTEALLQAGHVLKTGEKLPPPPGDTLGPIWFDHVDGIVLDVPRTIYPLQRSPRLLSLRARNQNLRGSAERAFEQRWLQTGERLLDRAEAAIRYQLRYDAQRVRSRILHFSTIENAPALVTRLAR
jgi:hypothetical protein